MICAKTRVRKFELLIKEKKLLKDKNVHLICN